MRHGGINGLLLRVGLPLLLGSLAALLFILGRSVRA